MIISTETLQYNHVQFLELNAQARSNAIKQMIEINKQEGLQDASSVEEFVELIIERYNPDRDYIFLQYPDANDDVTVYFKDFS